MRLRSPGSVDSAITMLTTLMNQLYDYRSGPGSQVRTKWLDWWERADAVLRSLFTDDDLVMSLYQARAEISRENYLAGPELTQRETTVWITRLEEVIRGLQSLKPFIERSGHIVVPDTSAFIEGAYFDSFAWHSLLGGTTAGDPVRLIIPILVLEELDGLKRDRRASGRSRSVFRRLWELHSGDPAEPASIPGKLVTIEVLHDDPWHVRRPVNDEEIIQRAAAIGEITGKIVVLTAADYAMLYRAEAVGLKAVLMPGPNEGQGAGQ
jgi:hypothetical protein